MINIKEISSLLGEQVKFVPTRTDNVHTAKKIGKEYEQLDVSQAFLKIGNSEHYSNAKIHSNSAPKGWCWLVLDYDDKRESGSIPDLKSIFGLIDTYTVKTPTGAGKQEWYLISEDGASRLPKSKYTIPQYPQVEIFVGHKNSKQVFVAPGSIKDGKTYNLTKSLKPSLVSDQLYQTLLIQANAERSYIEKNLQQRVHTFECEIDAQQNKAQFIRYLNSKIESFETGESLPYCEGEGRDQFIFDQCCQGFTYNLSENVVFELIFTKIVSNHRVIVDESNEFNEDYIWIKVRSAYNYITEANRSSERAKSKDLELFKEDEYGDRVVTRISLEKKVSYLSSYTLQKILSTEMLRKIFCETIIHDRDGGLYYVARMLPKERYEKLYKDSVERERILNDQINIQQLLSMKADTVLHWQTYTSAQLNETFYTFVGDRRRSLSNIQDFHNFSFDCYVKKTGADKTNVIENGTFFYETASPIEPAINATDQEKETVRTLVNSHIKRIVDPNNFEEEAEWLLDRFSLLLQNPHAKIDNAIIFKGSQGSGKTSFIEMLMLLFPRSDTNLILRVDDLENRFTNFARVTHIDDIDINVDKKTMNHIKALVTTSRVPHEEKYEKRNLEIGTVNISMSTNDPIDDEEVLFGRRWTVFVNEDVFLIEDIAKEVRELFSKLKADNWRLYRVLHKVLLEKDTSNFKSNFKTKAQRRLMIEHNKGNDFTIGLANIIANYGYIAPELQIFVPGELVNRHDILALLNHFVSVEKGDELLEIEEITQPEKGIKLFHIFADSREKRKRMRLFYNRVFEDPEITEHSRINDNISRTWSNRVPPIRDWIRLLSMYYFDNTNEESVKHMVDTFCFEDQWDWDNKTKPDLEGLGTINVFDSINLEDMFDEEDF